MPTYQNNPFTPLVLLQRGVPLYLFGSHNYKQANTRMLISNVVGNGTAATLTVQIVAGEIPTVGSLVSVQQTQTSSGAFNVSRAAITAVSINATTGAGTISFASATSVASTGDTGTAIAEVPEVPETLQAGASAACVAQIPECDSQKTIQMAVTFGTIPTAATVTLQQALVTQNVAEWTDTAAVVTVAASAYTAGAGPVVLATLQRGYAYRLNVTGLTIGSGVGIIGKLG